jgi:uncharacterized protein
MCLLQIPFRLSILMEKLTSSREMAVGNTFGATALSSYGGFWISFAIILTPGGFEIVASIETADKAVGVSNSLGLYLIVRPHPLLSCVTQAQQLTRCAQAWFIFTFILLICTLKSTVAFFLLFLTLDLAFLMLGISYLHLVDGAQDPTLMHAGGGFGLLAAFLAWYNALAGIADTSNRYVAPDLWFILLHRARQAASRPALTLSRICVRHRTSSNIH